MCDIVRSDRRPFSAKATKSRVALRPLRFLAARIQKDMEGKGSEILVALPLRRSRVEWGNQVSVFQLCSGEAVSSPGIPRSKSIMARWTEAAFSMGCKVDALVRELPGCG